jgi:GNAT superfamily N-acetyltransferase
MIRRARPDDHARVTEIRNSVRENVLRDPSRVTAADYKWFERNPGVWVWEENGRILGFSAADTRDGTIWALFIDPGHEGRGIGRALFARACDVLRETGHKTASLTTQPGSRADRFYQRAGWKVVGTSARGERIFHGVL